MDTRQRINEIKRNYQEELESISQSNHELFLEQLEELRQKYETEIKDVMDTCKHSRKSRSRVTHTEEGDFQNIHCIDCGYRETVQKHPSVKNEK